MSVPHNPHRSHAARRALVAAMLAGACTETTAPEPDRLVAIEIRAAPDLDTVRLGDSVTFTVWADTLVPSSVTWILEPAADTVVVDSLMYRPPAAGTVLVRALVTFPQDRVGVASRSVATPPNAAPGGTIEPVAPGDYARIPLGDTIAVTAAFDDPDGDSLSVTWYAGEPGSTGSPLLGSGDTLRLPVDSVGSYSIGVEVRDPAGARGTARMSAEAYDPMTPFAWRVYVGPLGHLTSTDDGLIVGNDGQKGDGSNALCDCPLVAFSADGQMQWSVTSGSGGTPIPSVGGAVYFTDDTGTLRRISRTGTVEWSLSDAVFGPVVLPDSSLVVLTSGPATGTPRRLRRVSRTGTVLWDVTPDTTITVWRSSGAAVGFDSAVYVVGSAWNWDSRTLLKIGPDGVERWRRPLGGTAVVVADDSTILVSGDSITALRPDGSVRWSRVQPTVATVVGVGDLAYTSWRVGTVVTLLAFRTTDGGDVWRVSVDSASGAPIPALLAADGTAVFSAGATLVAVDAATGAERWRHALTGAPGTHPVLTDDGLLVVSAGGYLEALDIGIGPLDAPWPTAWGGNRRLGRRQTP